MKTKYTIEEIYASMFKHNLQNETFEDGLAAFIKLEIPKATESKDNAPMIGLNPFKQYVKKPKDLITTKVKNFNESLNHRVSDYTKDK